MSAESISQMANLPDEPDSNWTVRIERVQKWTLAAIVAGAFGFGITAGSLVLRLNGVEKATDKLTDKTDKLTDKIGDISTQLAYIKGKLDTSEPQREPKKTSAVPRPSNTRRNATAVNLARPLTSATGTQTSYSQTLQTMTANVGLHE